MKGTGNPASINPSCCYYWRTNNNLQGGIFHGNFVRKEICKSYVMTVQRKKFVSLFY